MKISKKLNRNISILIAAGVKPETAKRIVENLYASLIRLARDM